LAGCVSGGGKSGPRPPLYTQAENLQSLAARGGVSYSDGQNRRYFKFELAAQKPDKILFTALDPAGLPAFRLASDGREISGILYGAREFFIGPASAENFARFLPLGLGPEPLLQLISGGRPNGEFKTLAIRYNALKPVAREDLNGAPENFPHSIEAEWADKNLRVTYSEIRLGLPVDDALFSLEQPRGFEFIELN
jgi:outer membrane lipoprotein-sorting protein